LTPIQLPHVLCLSTTRFAYRKNKP
jgi:hypothetical protein